MISFKRIVTALFTFFCPVIAFAQPLKGVADKIVAVVGDHIILQSEIQNSIKDILGYGGEITDSTACLLTEQALILKILMLQAQKDSLVVTDDEVEAELDQRIRYLINQDDIDTKLIYKLKDNVRNAVKERRLAEAMQEKILENVKITPAEVTAFFERIPKDNLPFYQSGLEIGQIVLHPRPSPDMDRYTYNETYRYKKQVEYSVTSFAQLVAKVSEDMVSKERGGIYELERNDKTWDPALLTAIFKLKEGEISVPIRTRLGFHLIQMVEKGGGNAVIRQILRIPPIADADIHLAVNRLDSIRSKIISGEMSFNQAATDYNENEAGNFPVYRFDRDGSPYIPVDQLDKEMAATVNKMNPGDISQAVIFTGQQGRKGVRLIYLKSRTKPHRMNLKDDYSKISQMALEEKRRVVLYAWIQARIPTFYIMVDNAIAADCPQIQKFANKD
jgi:peptidyl-prolyl cis-trans isomerase SurA